MVKKANRKNAKRAPAGLPAGFSSFAVGGGFGAWWDQYKLKTLTGKIVGYDSYPTTQTDDKGREKKVQRGIMKVQDAKGSTWNVGEAHALKELFTKENQKALRGKMIFIRFDGQEKFKNKKGKTQKVNTYTVAVK